MGKGRFRPTDSIDGPPASRPPGNASGLGLVLQTMNIGELLDRAAISLRVSATDKRKALAVIAEIAGDGPDGESGVVVRLAVSFPEALRTSSWAACSTRARVVVYNKATVNAEWVQTYEDLSNPRLKNQICVRSGAHPYNLSLGAAMLAHDGPVMVDCRVPKHANCFPMIPSGAAHTDMLLYGDMVAGTLDDEAKALV